MKKILESLNIINEKIIKLTEEVEAMASEYPNNIVDPTKKDINKKIEHDDSNTEKELK